MDVTRSLFYVIFLRVLGGCDQISVLCYISESTWWMWPDIWFVLNICEYLVDMTRSSFCVVFLEIIDWYDQILVFGGFATTTMYFLNTHHKFQLLKQKEKLFCSIILLFIMMLSGYIVIPSSAYFIVYKLTLWLIFLRMYNLSEVQVYCE